MRAYVLASAFIAVLLSPAAAKMLGSGQMEGDFVNGAGDLRTIESDDADRFYVGIRIGVGQCGGGVAGEANATDKTTMVMVVPSEFGDTHACIVSIKFSKDYRSVQTTEQGCLAFHGASCDFEQTFSRRPLPFEPETKLH